MSIKTFIRDRVIASSDILMELYLWASKVKYGLRGTSAGRLVQPAHGRRKKFLIDLTCLASGAIRGGIPRFIECTFTAWHSSPPEDHDVVPICSDGISFRCVDTNGLLEKIASREPLVLLDEVEVAPGDVYFSGEELSGPNFFTLYETLLAWRSHGVQINMTVHTNNLAEPDLFNPFLIRLFKLKIKHAIKNSYNILCISRWTADGILDYAADCGVRNDDHKIGCTICIGADIKQNGSTSAARNNVAKGDGHTFIMVGSLIQRKGYLQVLDAFKILWENGVAAKLIIIGSRDHFFPGSDGVYERIITDPALGKELIFLEAASDEELVSAYAGADAIICASWFDNHNMPMIEAARYGTHVIARDFPVFHEIAGDSAFYFQGREPEDLASAIKEWMRLDAEGRAPKPDGIKLYTWAECVKEWEKIIFGGDWYWQNGRYRDERLMT